MGLSPLGVPGTAPYGRDVTEAFFFPLDPVAGEDRFLAAPAGVGPWSADALHGGPPAALAVRACERVAHAAGGEHLVALRAGIDFLGPVPLGSLHVRARVVRSGRRITLTEARVEAGGRPVAIAHTWLLRTSSVDAPDLVQDVARSAADPMGRPPEAPRPGPQACPPAMTDWAFPYARALEWRHVAGDPGRAGDAAAWARPRIPLVPGETLSGLQRAVLIADSGNGISAALDWDRWSFVNVDLAVHLSRDVRGEWVLLDARTRYEPGGTGLATSVLHDVDGAIGAGAQTLVISRLAGSG